jgi:hypothetical protein
MIAHLPSVSLRRARFADAPALHRLAALTDAAPLSGDVVVADVGGELRAAMSLADGRTIADPFRETAELVALLQVRRRHHDDDRPRRPRRIGLSLVPARAA